MLTHLDIGTSASRLACLLALLALGAGCRVYDPDLVRETDAGGGGGDCAERRQPPARPSGPDGTGPEIAFGMREVVMDQGDDWPMYGYDVDGFCTEAPDLVSECTPPGASRAPVDGPGGVDNVFGRNFFPVVVLTTPDLESEAREAQENGQGLPIVRVRGWNGEPDDPRVDVAIMQAVFGTPGTASDDPPARPAEPEASRPTWDGHDWFWVREDAFLADDLERPLIRDDNAYVADGMLVARLPDRIDIIFPADDYGVLVRLTGAQVTGRIADDRSGLEDVIVAGRWSLNDLLFTARNIGVCEGTGNYTLLRSQLDRIADVRSTPGTGGPGVQCDAISLGVGFTGTRVRVAGLAPGPPLADLCATASDGGMPDGGVPDAGP